MPYQETVEDKLRQREDWVFRGQKGIPNSQQLFVLACMDERLPVEEVLGVIVSPGRAGGFKCEPLKADCT